MQKYEVRFGSATSHPHFVMARSKDEAIDMAVRAANKGTKTVTTANMVSVCVPTNKVSLASVAKQYTKTPSNRVNVSLNFLESHIKMINDYGYFNMEPDFQRAHVWAPEQQVKYVEHLLKGGKSGTEILLNCPGWDEENNRSFPTVLVDGLQRLTAVRKFMKNDLIVFDKYTLDSFEYLYSIDLVFCTNNLETEKEVFQWYLEMNSGGTPHTEEELNKVRQMLADKE